MNLEDRIRQLAKSGQITHITLAPTIKRGWQAGYRDATSDGYRVGIADDPIDALMEALSIRNKPIVPRGPRKDLIG